MIDAPAVTSGQALRPDAGAAAVALGQEIPLSAPPRRYGGVQ